MKHILINATMHTVLFVASVVGTVAAPFLALFAATLARRGRRRRSAH